MAKGINNKCDECYMEYPEYEALKADPTLESLQLYKLHKMMHKFWMRFDKEVIDEILTCGKEVI